MKLDDMIAVLQAAKEGKPIQRSRGGGYEWREFNANVFAPEWDFYRWNYRVRPEPREWDLRCEHVYEVGGAGSINALANVGNEAVRVREVLPES